MKQYIEEIRRARHDFDEGLIGTTQFYVRVFKAAEEKAARQLIMDDPYDDGGLSQEEIKSRLAPWFEEPSS